MKTNLDNLFKTDSQTELDGVWFDISDTVGFLLRRFNDSNPNIKKAMATYYKPYARQIEMGTLDPQKAKEIDTKIFVNSCFIDWKGVEIDGILTPFDKEVAVKFLLRLPDLSEALFKYSSDFKNFKIKDEGSVEDLGNS